LYNKYSTPSNDESHSSVNDDDNDEEEEEELNEIDHRNTDIRNYNLAYFNSNNLNSVYPHNNFEELRKDQDDTIWNANKISPYNALSGQCSSSGSESENRHHPCTECGKTFATSSGLKQHMHIHSSVKPFQCEVCFKAYTQFSNLCRHKRMHADCRTQVKCRFCGQTFSNSAALNKHRRFCGDVNTYSSETPKPSLNKEQLNSWLWNSSSLPYSLIPYLPRFATLTPTAPNTCTTIPYFNTFLTANTNTHPSPLSSSSSIATSDEITKTKYNKNNSGCSSIKTNKSQNDVVDDMGSSTNSPEQLKDTTKVNGYHSTSKKRTLKMEDNDDEPLDLTVKKSKMSYFKNNDHTDEHHHDYVSSSSSSSKSSSPALNTMSNTPHSTPIDNQCRPSSLEKIKSETNTNQTHSTNGSSSHSLSTSEQCEQRCNSTTISKYNVESLLNKKCVTSSCENNKTKNIPSKSPLSNMATLTSPLNLEVLKRIYHTNNVFSNPTTSTVAAAAFSQLSLNRGLTINYDSWQSNTLNKLNYLNTRTNKDKYSCQYCGKVFPRSANLTRHLRTHTGEQPYRCKYCERSFSISSNLQRHIRNIHNREKPFLCTLCDRRFAQQTNLERHVKKHENGLPYDSCSGDEDNEIPSTITTNGSNDSLLNHHVELYEQHTLNSEPSSTRRSSSLSLSDGDCSRIEEEDTEDHGIESSYFDVTTAIENDEREVEQEISSD
ncbi:unnamed protein product, partial [Didymodactylos carnosus]